MKRAIRLLIGLAILAGGVLISLWGLFWFLYRGDEGSGAVYIGLSGSDINAQVVGLIAITIGLVAIWVSDRLLRSWRQFANQNANLF